MLVEGCWQGEIDVECRERFWKKNLEKYQINETEVETEIEHESQDEEEAEGEPEVEDEIDFELEDDIALDGE